MKAGENIVVVKSLAFNSLYEIPQSGGRVITWALPSSFNSLYEIPNWTWRTCWCNHSLSILFMRFRGHGKTRYYCLSCANFQFSLWDSPEHLVGLKILSVHFQFSLWDSQTFSTGTTYQMKWAFNSLYEILQSIGLNTLLLLKLSILFMRLLGVILYYKRLE